MLGALHPVYGESTRFLLSCNVRTKAAQIYQTSKMRKVSEGWMMNPASSLKLQQLVNKSINQMAENESSITVMNSSSFSCSSF